MSHNPFEPHTVESADIDDGDGLDGLKKQDLVDTAEVLGLATSGTKSDLIGRIREHRSA